MIILGDRKEVYQTADESDGNEEEEFPLNS